MTSISASANYTKINCYGLNLALLLYSRPISVYNQDLPIYCQMFNAAEISISVHYYAVSPYYTHINKMGSKHYIFYCLVFMFIKKP